MGRDTECWEKQAEDCDVRNIPSERVMEKVDMMLIDSTGIRYNPKTGRIADEYVYAIDRDKSKG